MNNVIFILSLPRSGSTLLQRILSVHPEISTVSEPWLLLPAIYALRGDGVYAEYSAKSVSKALREVVANLPNGMSDYYDAVRRFAFSIYGKLGKKGGSYFLDKTPRYFLIIDEIEKVFPQAKFIFLFRQPLATYASMIHAFNKGRLGDARHRVDAYEGPLLLARGWERLETRAHKIHFEELLIDAEYVIPSLCDYLEVEYMPEMLEGFTETFFGGSMGDSIGTKEYTHINSAPLTKWKGTFSTKFRKRHAKRYLRYLGEETIKKHGYDLEILIKEIDELEASGIGAVKDLFDLFKGKIYCFFDIMMMKDKIKRQLRCKHEPSNIYYAHY